MQELQANTQVKVVVGPFVDVGDGFTPETGVTLGGADEAELVKHDSATVTDISGNTWAAIASCDGYYNLTLTAAQLDTEGMLTVVIQDDDVCLPVRIQYMIVAQAYYTSKYTAKDTGFMDVNIKTVGRADAQETEANNLETACANYSATRGLSGTALPAAVADAAGGLPISDAGGLDLDTQINTNIDAILVDTNSLNDTKIPQTLNLTASGNIGIDWANVENPTTALDLSGTDIQLVDTCTTVTGGATSAELAKVPKSDGTATWNATALASINTECDTALTDYDAPTKAEMDTAHGLLATELAKIGTPVALDSGAATLGGMLTKMADDNSGADFDAGTDSLQEIRDRGDTGWTTGGGGAISLETGTVASASTANTFTLSAGFPAVAKAYPPGTIITVTDADDSNIYMGRIRSYTAGRVVTLYSPLAITPANADVAVVWNTFTLQPDF